MIKPSLTPKPKLARIGLAALATLSLVLTVMITWADVTAQTMGASKPRAGSETTSEQSLNPVVVELFTSQGCSSCPPADAFLRTLAKRDDVIALSWGVTYWDYLGWRDTMASPAGTRRQRAYGKRFGQVYTPQMIINGQDQLVGSRRRAALDKITRAGEDRAATGEAAIDLDWAKGPNADQPSLTLSGPMQETALSLRALIVDPEFAVDIKAGENKGRSMRYANVVRRVHDLGSWSGGDARIDLDPEALAISPGQAVYVILQQGQVGPIHQARRLNLNEAENLL